MTESVSLCFPAELASTGGSTVDALPQMSTEAASRIAVSDELGDLGIPMQQRCSVLGVAVPHVCT